MPNLILRPDMDRIAHEFKAIVIVPAHAGRGEIAAIIARHKDEFVRGMRLQGYEYTGLPMTAEGPKPYLEPRTVPTRPTPRRYRPGQPRENREAEARAAVAAVADVPDVNRVDSWYFVLKGRFHAPPILVEHLPHGS